MKSGTFMDIVSVHYTEIKSLFKTRSYNNGIKFDEDLFTLIKRVVEVGVDNYNYDKVLEMLDFYVTIGKLDWDAWDVIFGIMESQLEA